MNYVIFKVSFFNNYNGIEDTSLNIYDRFYQEKKSNNPEQYNFQDYNNFCYGYASLKPGVVNLSNINFTNDNSTLLRDALVIWVYEDNTKHYIVGWYKNASVYNFLQKEISYPSVGRDLYYNVKAKSTNCYLLPVEKRTFNINIPFKDNNNFYIGNENDILYQDILNFINTYNGNFINNILSRNIDEVLKDAPKNPTLLYKRGSIYLYNESNFLEALKYFNTTLLFKDMLSKNEITDVYYSKAMCLQFLNCFDCALFYFEKVISNIEYDINILKNMIYLCIYTKKYHKAINYCDTIITSEQKNEQNIIFLDEISCLKVDCYLSLKQYDLAKDLLISIKNNTLSKELSNYCENKLKQINPRY
ncbi:hypothetical protein [uncultured Tyzzerella sp.]|uniref:tetratricopeptide repeat protein n=1 Tax=uncultured Tyzzerella sp. TaxID=2321398 RepID=UPI002943B2C0|nr:hypothetical protein [uncultured Tyzzerella sp.]